MHSSYVGIIIFVYVVDEITVVIEIISELPSLKHIIYVKKKLL